MTLRLRLLLLCFLAIAPAALARVISYAPYTTRSSHTSYHHRGNRWFALAEALPGEIPIYRSQVVLYDALGVEEPRVVYPGPVETRQVTWVAVHESQLLIASNESTSSGSMQVYLFSGDGGTTWKRLAELDGQYTESYPDVDTGGPYARGMKAPVTAGGFFSFVVATNNGLYGIDGAANVKVLLRAENNNALSLVGRDRDGTRFLVRAGNSLRIVDKNGMATTLFDIPGANATGWITSNGSVYVQYSVSYYRFLYLYRNGQKELVGGPAGVSDTNAGILPYPGTALTFFAIPTHDYEGAWMIQRSTGKPTTLLRHTPASGKETLWTDVSGPEVEALHTGAAGDTLLIQVHRPRAQAERWFLDPALAVWHVGQPAPRAYDELFLNETYSKGFVHLNVDEVAGGAPFVFDSGFTTVSSCPNCSPSPVGGVAGGADVTQEWGVVRASLKQRLVLPGIARQPGAFNSYWLTDLVIHNPLDRPQRVDFRFVAIGGEVAASAAKSTFTTLAAHEVRVVKDVVKELFAVEQGGGTLYIDPESGVSATARTYTRAGEGTFGFGMPAIDFLNAASPRFPVTFAGAFPGSEYRTNVLLTDTSGRGTEARFRAHGILGMIGVDNVALSAPVNGVLQMNGLAGMLGLSVTDAGGLEVQPTRGTMIVSVVAMDNRTNDPTFFPPDLPAPVVRTIPAIGHVDGAHNAKFRSDLFLMNPTESPRTVQLEAKPWDSNAPGKIIPFTLLPGEARVIRDVLPTLFKMTGIARLRYNSGDPGSNGVRVTSRTYNVDENGWTYGCLIPPLNSFQSAGPGEQLEILGIVGGSGFRTNIGLVELTPGYNGTNAEARIHIVDDQGKEIDQFTMTLPTAGGTQINDIFSARGITAPAAAIVYVEVTKGLIGAYATLTDNVTNDSTYLGANLSAQPN